MSVECFIDLIKPHRYKNIFSFLGVGGMNKSVYSLAKRITENYFNSCMMGVIGAKVVGNYMYVKGGDNGFPHTRAHVKVDLGTGEIVCYYNAHDCPVYVPDGIYE